MIGSVEQYEAIKDNSGRAGDAQFLPVTKDDIVNLVSKEAVFLKVEKNGQIGKGLKRSKVDETLLEAEAKKKQSNSSRSSSSSNYSNSQQIQEDLTRKGNTIIP
ncbi:MAG: hypothetical protein EZS28_029675 [Streblomastix strix]|uniref:Uncharacterized protein n=1 Tax=Streblomastix strix TaxID=222440 RepID=A0A5J4UWF9_9EUKA|nr:MAG: hypothetical protein EZS28_029675 [Streblomastix strix]